MGDAKGGVFPQDRQRLYSDSQGSEVSLSFLNGASSVPLGEPHKQPRLRLVDSMLLMALISQNVKDLNNAYNQGASLSLRSGADSPTPIIIASSWGLCGVVEWLLETGGVTLLKARTNSGASALIAATREHQVPCASLLLSRGADKEDRNVSGRTSMLVACEHNSVGMVKLLLGHDASTTCADNEGYEPLMMAASKGNIEILCLLLKQSKTDLVSRTNKKGWNALFFAAAFDHLECCTVLISFGAVDKTKDVEMQTADNVWGSLTSPPLDLESKWKRRNALRNAFLAHAELLAARDEAWGRKKAFVMVLSGHRLIGPRALELESLVKTRRRGQKSIESTLRVFTSGALIHVITKFL